MRPRMIVGLGLAARRTACRGDTRYEIDETSVLPKAPAAAFWSTTVYDVATRCVIDNKQPIADKSSRMELLVNDDGSDRLDRPFLTFLAVGPFELGATTGDSRTGVRMEGATLFRRTERSLCPK